MNLYNVKSLPSGFLVTKFDEDLNIQSSYITTLTTCECPAGQRPTCRHRQMLPQFIENRAVDANLFYEFETKTFYDGPREEPLDDVVMDELNATLETQTEVLATMAEVVSETEAPGHTDLMISPEAIDDAIDSITDNQIAITNLKSSALDDLETDVPTQLVRFGYLPENECPGHITSGDDPKVCGLCGTHIDSLRPEPMTPAEEAENAKYHNWLATQAEPNRTTTAPLKRRI